MPLRKALMRDKWFDYSLLGVVVVCACMAFMDGNWFALLAWGAVLFSQLTNIELRNHIELLKRKFQ